MSRPLTVIHTSREPSNDRLLVRLESENAGVRCVRSLRHVQMKRCPESFGIVFEAAYQCAQQLAKSEVGQRFLNNAPNMYSQYPERLELDEKLKSELGQIIKTCGEKHPRYDQNILEADRWSGSYREALLILKVRLRLCLLERQTVMV